MRIKSETKPELKVNAIDYIKGSIIFNKYRYKCIIKLNKYLINI